ncbi:hypothetical protein [Chitinophaga sp.]|uniref:hypothetical protein n=1 Tax=Chitinophaga sp. TaxID=1869181 RepID=UPI0031DC1921
MKRAKIMLSAIGLITVGSSIAYRPGKHFGGSYQCLTTISATNFFPVRYTTTFGNHFTLFCTICGGVREDATPKRVTVNA